MTSSDIAAIDAAGATGARRFNARSFLRKTVAVALVGAAVLGVCGYFRVKIL